jgi:hypothetical protein
MTPDALLAALRHPEPDVRAKALDRLRQVPIATAEIRAAIAACLDDTAIGMVFRPGGRMRYCEVRLVAAEALAVLGAVERRYDGIILDHSGPALTQDQMYPLRDPDLAPPLADAELYAWLREHQRLDRKRRVFWPAMYAADPWRATAEQVAAEVTRRSEGAVTLTWEQCAASDAVFRERYATNIVVDGAPLGDHPEYAHWQRGGEPVVLAIGAATALGLPRTTTIADVIRATKLIVLGEP